MPSTKISLRFGLLAALLLSDSAMAQEGSPYFPQTLPSGSVVGRLSSGPGPTEAISMAALLSALFPAGSVANPLSAASVAFQGRVTGAVTVQAQAAAGTWTLQWPTVPGANGDCLSETVSGSVATAQWVPCAIIPIGNITGLGTGVATALGFNTGSPGAFVVNGGPLGTPSSGTLTNATGLPISTGLTGTGTGVLPALANSVTGTGSMALSASPAFTGTPSAPTASPGTNTTQLASTAFVQAAVSSGVSGVSQLNGQTGNLAFYQTPQIRLTLTQGTPVTTSDVTAATAVFLEPYNGAQLTIYDGSANWVPVPVASSTYSLPATQTQSGTTHTNTVLDGLTDTSQMVVGEQVTGTNIAANSVIATITSTTAVTLNNATTGSATNTMTFKLPPSTAYDVYALNNSGVPKLVWSAAWSGTTPPTRALQNGVYVLSGTTTQRLLGSVFTSTVAGQLMDSALCRCLSNLYNQVPRSLKLQESASSWNQGTGGAAWEQAAGSAANQIEVMFTVPGFAQLDLQAMWTPGGSTGNAWVGIGVDSASVPSSTISSGGTGAAATITVSSAEYIAVPGIGPHFLAWLEFGIANGNPQWIGTDGAPDRIQAGMVGMVAN